MKSQQYSLAPRLAAACLISFLPLALTLPVAAQDSEEPRAGFTGQVDVTEVLLDVLVTDKKGNVVVGLEAGDFVVEEDGKPVEISMVASGWSRTARSIAFSD